MSSEEGNAVVTRRKFLEAACVSTAVLFTPWMLMDSLHNSWKEISMGMTAVDAADNKVIVRESFERWAKGTGGPFELLAEDASWTIVGSSPLSKTYRSKQKFMADVIEPFNARMANPLVPVIRGLFADGDTVIIFFDASATAKDGVPYHNTYAWFFHMKDGRVVEATAFFDTREFDEFWARVSPE